MNLDNLTPSGEDCIRQLSRLSEERSADDKSLVAWTLTSSVTLVEAHVSRVIDSLVSVSNVTATTIGAALFAEVASDIDRSWKNRLGWLKKGFNIELAGDSVTQEFMTAVDARNAIIHGAGYLTGQQTRDPKRMIQLRRRIGEVLEVDFIGNYLVISDRTRDRIIAVSRNFVAHLDSITVANYPALRLNNPDLQ